MEENEEELAKKQSWEQFTKNLRKLAEKSMQAELNNRCPKEVIFTEDEVIITLTNGSKVSTPLSSHPWLASATESQRQNYELFPFSVFWDELDEGLDIESMLRRDNEE